MKQIVRWMCMAAVSAAAISCGAGEIEEPKAEPLAAPSVRLLDGDVIGWDHVPGAVYYIPNINGVDQERTAENTMDLSVFGVGEYSVKVKAAGDGKKHSDSPWSQVFTHRVSDQESEPDPDPDPEQPVAVVLATPVLSVVVPSFATPSEAYVSWVPVENADSYVVKVDDAEIAYEGCRADLIKFKGGHVVTVQAVNGQKPDEFLASTAASAEFYVNNYGTGSEDDPYLIYTISDWNQMADVVNNSEGTYVDRYIALAQDLDCIGETVKTVGTDQNSFEGILDGKGKVMRNAVIGSESTSCAGLFAYMNGTVRNLIVDGFEVTGSGTTSVISGGKMYGNIEGVTVKNSTVTSGGDYGGIIVARSGGSNKHFTDCKVQACTLKVTKGSVGAICGRIENTNLEVSGCEVSNTVISGTGSIGGIIGLCGGSAVISDCIVSGSEISGSNTNVGGIVGVSNNAATVIDGCVSRGNTVTSSLNNPAYVGGLVGDMQAGCLINSTSDGNTVDARKSFAGGLAGHVTAGNIINNISSGCTVSSERSTVKDQYIGLVVGADEASATGSCKNNIVASGSLKYGSAATVGKVGIITGVRLTNTVYDINYYNASLVENADATGGKNVLPLTGPMDTFDASALKHGGSNPIGEGYEPALSDLHTVLNANVETLSATYPTIRKWQAVAGGWPVHVKN